MKKIFATIAGLAVGVSLVHAQGWLQLTSGVVYNANTNTGTFGNVTVPDSGDGYSTVVSGKVAPGDNYSMSFLFWSAGGLASADGSNSVLNSGWEQLAVDLSGLPGPALFATNTAFAGNFQGQGSANSVPAIGINGDAFNNGTQYQVAIVAWSDDLGTNWLQLSGELKTGNWIADGFFGYVIGNDINPSSAAPGVGIGGGAMSSNGSLVLYSTPVPEPAMLALAGLGGLSMLFLRRRKSE